MTNKRNLECLIIEGGRNSYYEKNCDVSRKPVDGILVFSGRLVGKWSDITGYVLNFLAPNRRYFTISNGSYLKIWQYPLGLCNQISLYILIFYLLPFHN